MTMGLFLLQVLQQNAIVVLYFCLFFAVIKKGNTNYFKLMGILNK